MTINAISHVEWHCRDLPTSCRFLEQLFGWTFSAFGRNYALYTPSVGTCVGLKQIAQEPPPAGNVRFFVNVSDIHGSVRQAEALGGTVETPPTRIPGYGYYAHLLDPEGAPIGLFQAPRPQD